MSWLEKGISSLKGQISNFTKEVLADDTSGAAEPPHDRDGAQDGAQGAVSGEGVLEGDDRSEGFFGQALGPLAQLSLFGRGETSSSPSCAPTHQDEPAETSSPAPTHRDEPVEHDRLLVEATVKTDMRQFHELPTGTRSNTGSNAGSGDSPQLSGVDDVGVSPALSEDGFTKLDPSETELWEATQELSQTSEQVQLEFQKKELERLYQMKQEWVEEKSNLQSTIHNLQIELQALQDWQTPDQDFLNANETDRLNMSQIQKENEELLREKTENSEMIESLQSQLLTVEKENSELRAGMEELDSQHEDALERVLQMKKDIQVKYEALYKEHETLNNLFKSEKEGFLLLKKEKIDFESKLALSELSSQSLEKDCELLKERISSLEADNEALQKGLSSIQSDQCAKLTEKNENLKLKLSLVESEKRELLSKLNSVQLDMESLDVKLSTVVSENETLKTKLSAMECELQSARSEIEERLSESVSKTSDSNSNDHGSTERYIIEKLKTIISLDIPMEYCKDIASRDEASEKELEDQLDSVAALVKMTVDLKWKKDTLERNLVDYTRQLREMTAQVNARDKKIAKLEDECVVLRENMESLLDGLNVTPEKGMLPSIPETPEAGEEDSLDMGPIQEEDEEVEEEMHAAEDSSHQIQHREQSRNSGGRELNATIGRLERELDVLREARTNLEHESERLRDELQDLASRLRSSESMLRNQDNLEREVERWREQYEQLRVAHHDLQTENNSLKEEAEMARFGQDSLQAEVSEWKTVADTASQERQDAVSAKEALVAEISDLKADLKDTGVLKMELENTIQAKNHLEKEVQQLRESLEALALSNKCLEEKNVIIEESKSEIADLKKKLISSEENRAELAIKIHELTDHLGSLKNEKQNLSLSVANNEELINKITSDKTNLLQELSLLQEKFDAISFEMAQKANSESSSTLQLLEEKQSLAALVSELQESCGELSMTKSSLQSEISQLKGMLMEESKKCQYLETAVYDKQKALEEENHAAKLEVQSLQEKVRELQSSHNSSVEIQGDISSVEALERRLCTMLEEKEQMLSVLTEKSRENGILRSENQKLLSTISSYQDEQQMPADSDQIKLLIQQVAQLQQEKDQLIATVQVKHNESVQYHTEILRLSTLLNQQQNILLNANEQGTQNPTINLSEPKLDNSTEMHTLEEKCAALASSLQQERVQNSYLQNEMQEQHEKEGMLTKELERLRIHLMEVEESHTAETLRLEEQVQDLQGKLDAAEERLRSISTVHTSASIRANQHVESLQGQSRLISQQRDELQSKLSAAEDRELKNAAALRNLQAVLEQFQKDKERDLASMTEKLRLELQSAHKKHCDLSEEIRVLKDKLTEAKEGLSAAARLGEQLDKKSETISALKTQISQLQEELKAAEGRVQSVEGKVDKSLVKNLVVGLLTAPANTRSPALRVVASVLDFSREERQRVGLEQGPNQQSEQSLSEAFVRFLESESRPQMQFRLLPEASANTGSRAAGRKDSVGSGSTSGDSPIRRSPLLSEVVLPTLAPLPVGRSSSSILKDVLKRNDV